MRSRERLCIFAGRDLICKMSYLVAYPRDKYERRCCAATHQAKSSVNCRAGVARTTVGVDLKRFGVFLRIFGSIGDVYIGQSDVLVQRRDRWSRRGLQWRQGKTSGKRWIESAESPEILRRQRGSNQPIKWPNRPPGIWIAGIRVPIMDKNVGSHEDGAIHLLVAWRRGCSNCDYQIWCRWSRENLCHPVCFSFTAGLKARRVGKMLKQIRDAPYLDCASGEKPDGSWLRCRIKRG